MTEEAIQELRHCIKSAISAANQQEDNSQENVIDAITAAVVTWIETSIV